MDSKATQPRHVMMPAIPGKHQRGRDTRSDLGYLPYARATWQWWCERHQIQFTVLTRPESDVGLVDAPPVIQRWMAAERLLRDLPPSGVLAMVDADTMIRWDTPDFLAAAGPGLGAVQSTGAAFFQRSLAAYQRFFPGVDLPFCAFINTGVVVLRPRHAPLLRALIRFYADHRIALETLQKSGEDIGVDQTPFNLMVRAQGEAVDLLPRAFNFVGCVQLSDDMRASVERPEPAREPSRQASVISAVQNAFGFIDLGFVWHFTNVVKTRTAFMRQTWNLVHARYPGAALP